MEGQNSEQILTSPIHIETQTIPRLTERLKGQSKAINMISEAYQVLTQLPNDKTGIVLGVGDNKPVWTERGWKTLDINPETDADHIADANELEKVAASESQDYLYAEAIKFDKFGWEGVGPGRLLQQAYKALKQGGMLIIESAHVEGDSLSQLPDRRKYVEVMQEHGFEVVVELDEVYEDPTYLDQRVVYYCKKSKKSKFQ